MRLSRVARSFAPRPITPGFAARSRTCWRRPIGEWPAHEFGANTIGLSGERWARAPRAAHSAAHDRTHGGHGAVGIRRLALSDPALRAAGAIADFPDAGRRLAGAVG